MAYTTATLVEAELRVSEAFSASTSPTLTQVNTWIDEESAQIDNDYGRSFESTQYTDVINYDGYDTIQLKVAPIISVDRVEYTAYDLGTSSYALDQTAVEDTDYTLNDIRNQFGEKVARIIDGLTKIEEIFDHSNSTLQAENFKKNRVTIN